MKKKNRISFRGFTILFTAALLCLLLAGCGIIEVLTTEQNTAKGFFRDIKDWRGAVVGTSYEQATNEITMSVTVNTNELAVKATFVNSQIAPYCVSKTLGIYEYQIVDANSRTIQEGSAEATEIDDGQATVIIQVDNIASGNYKLIVAAFVVSEGAGDQLLNINGNWECEFTV